MKYTVQYNRDGHPTKTRMMTNDYERAAAYFDKMLADSHVTNVEFLESSVILQGPLTSPVL